MAISVMNMIFCVIHLLLITHFSGSEYIPPGPRYICPSQKESVNLFYPCECLSGSDVGVFVKCQNSGLASLSVGLGNLAAYDIPVEELVLKECSFQRLYGQLLHKLKVRVLRIEDTPLTKILENAFYGVNNTLQELFIVGTNLQVFPKEAFKMLGNLTTLHIDKHQMETLDKDIFLDSLALGKLEKLRIINGMLKDLPVESFQLLRKLKVLDLHRNNLSALKRNQFKGLRDAEFLDISYNNISKLESVHIADLTKLSWCNVSNNNLQEITRGMFARNAVLRVLNLNNNHIKRLDTNSFRGMRFLRRLFLADNEISDVGRGTFGSITRIGTIDLARNKIKKIDYQMFYQLNYVELLDVSHNQVTEIQKQAFKDLYLTTINLSHNQISKIEADSFENCANITLLDLSYNNLSKIIPKAFDYTTYATELQLSFNNFTELNQIPLHNMTGLKILNISHNAIHTIPKNTFPKLYELHTIDVSHNVLKEIASAVFQSLFSLRNLNLSYNSLEQIKLPTFGTLPTLLELNLSHNNISDISRGSLVKLASCRKMDVSHNRLQKIFQLPISLGEIDLSDNEIAEIPENLWPSMNALLSLDLSRNPLASGLSSSSFENLLTLRVLSFVECGLTEPPWEALSKLSSLQYLYLNKNNITTLQKAAFGRLPIVFQLDLSDNQISNISVKAFDGLLQLLTLSLRNNHITHIPNGAFYGLVSLRSLDLSHNFIERIDNKTNSLIEDCLSLEKINLSNNKISFLTRKSFPSNPYIPYKLSEIDLSYNKMPVLTNDILFGGKKVAKLNLSHNMLNDLRRDVIGNLTSLHHLDLSFNNLNDLTSEKGLFHLPENITSVILANNQLSSLPLEYIKNATKLRYLDVSYNKLASYDALLVRKTKNEGLQVLFDGNPLNCDCFSRPLKHFLNHLPKSYLANNTIYSNISCQYPGGLNGIKFLDVEDYRLNCDSTIGTEELLDNTIGTERSGNSDYDPESDLVLRDVKFSQNSILIQWFVKSSKDIADFRIIIRNKKNDIFYAADISYNQREFTITISESDKLNSALKQKPADMELCVLAGNSNSVAGRWFQNQCKNLPEDFSLLKKTTAVNTLRRRPNGSYYRSTAQKLQPYNSAVNVLLIFSLLSTYFLI